MNLLPSSCWAQRFLGFTVPHHTQTTRFFPTPMQEEYHLLDCDYPFSKLSSALSPFGRLPIPIYGIAFFHPPLHCTPVLNLYAASPTILYLPIHRHKLGPSARSKLNWRAQQNQPNPRTTSHGRASCNVSRSAVAVLKLPANLSPCPGFVDARIHLQSSSLLKDKRARAALEFFSCQESVAAHSTSIRRRDDSL